MTMNDQPKDHSLGWDVLLDAHGNPIRFRKDAEQDLAARWGIENGSRVAPRGLRDPETAILRPGESATPLQGLTREQLFLK
jgi:hypothetical protein